MIKNIKVFVIHKAMLHLDQATTLQKFKTNKLAIYGESYSKTFEFARVELLEAWNILLFNFFNSFINK